MELIRWRCLALAIFAFATTTTARAEDCKLTRGASIDLVNNVSDSPEIAGSIAGKPTNFIVDTGGDWSFLPPRLSEGSTPVKLPPGLSFIDITGATITSAIGLPDLEFGPVKFEKSIFMMGIDATLGANVLKVFDVELDPVARKLNLFRQKQCDGSAAYWAHQDITVIPFKPNIMGKIIFPVELDGVTLRAQLDTGSPETVLNLPTGHSRFHIDPGTPGTEAAPSIYGLSGNHTGEYRHQFNSLKLGDLEIGHPWVRLAGNMTDVDLILGMNVIAPLHLYIAYAEHKLYVTTMQGDIAAGRSVPTGPGATDPLAEINRNESLGTAADAARSGHYAQALAVLDPLIAATPDDPIPLLMRSTIRQSMNDGAGAQTDFDRAAIIVPQSVDGFVTRAQAYGNLGKWPLAIADYTHALQLAPDSVSILKARAIAYFRTKQYDLSLQDDDATLRLAPNSAGVLDDRCWIEGLKNHLEAALFDCNAALALAPKFADALDSRAFVQLKAGRYTAAITDYDAALALDPKLASSLYGRSLAKKRIGDLSGADADFAAARALDPQIEQTFGM